jgi:hypothetical protein
LVTETRAELLSRRIELYRDTLRAGARGHVAIEYLRQIENDEAELAKIMRAQDSPLSARGLSADLRPIRSLSRYVSELVHQFDALAVTDPQRGAVASRIRRVEKEIARRRRAVHR